MIASSDENESRHLTQGMQGRRKSPKKVTFVGGCLEPLPEEQTFKHNSDTSSMEMLRLNCLKKIQQAVSPTRYQLKSADPPKYSSGCTYIGSGDKGPDDEIRNVRNISMTRTSPLSTRQTTSKARRGSGQRKKPARRRDFKEELRKRESRKVEMSHQRRTGYFGLVKQCELRGEAGHVSHGHHRPECRYPRHHGSAMEVSDLKIGCSSPRYSADYTDQHVAPLRAVAPTFAPRNSAPRRLQSMTRHMTHSTRANRFTMNRRGGSPQQCY